MQHLIRLSAAASAVLLLLLLPITSVPSFLLVQAISSSLPLSSSTSTPIRTLQPSTWHAEAHSHRHAVSSILQVVGHNDPGALNLNLTDPISNFMCDYYRVKPRRLLEWSPGPWVGLHSPFHESAQGLLLRGNSRHGVARNLMFAGEPDVGMFDPTCIPSHTLDAFHIDRSILIRTEERSPIFSCFGLHEWAILYHPPNAVEAPVRHQERDNPDLKLRVAQDVINGVVEGRIPVGKDTMPLRCTHFDAIRFFHPDARPHNTVVPEPNRSTQALNEQPGCVHAHMDLLFYALRLGPFIPSDLFRQCLQCAMDSRAVDVRATPYAVPDPICVETVAGRKEYAKAQEELFERAKPVRRKLIEAYGPILDN
jgi:hypothetical protein